MVREELREDYAVSGKPAFSATNSYTPLTPGLCKVEWRGDVIIALCLKTYYSWKGEETNNGGQACFTKSNTERHFVDEYIADLQTVLQFHGCSFHSHGYRFDKVRNENLRKKTHLVTTFLQSLALTVIEKWECE